MSVTRLTAIAAYHASPRKIDIDYGAANIEFDGARKILTLDHAPLNGGLRPPEGGLLLLYGLRDCMEEMRVRRTRARTRGDEFHFAELSVEVGEIPTSKIEREDLKTIRFANVLRMSAALQSMILTTFAKYIEGEGGDPESLDGSMSAVNQIATRPDLFGRLMEKHPEFKHLDVLVIPVSDDPKRPTFVRQMAIVRSGAQISEMAQNVESSEFVLPDWFKSRSGKSK